MSVRHFKGNSPMVIRSLIGAVIGVVFLVLVAQVVPYGHNHSDAPVIAEPNWDSPQTRDLAARACFDCHSNQTEWPWYSNVAPMSWLIQHDADEGRSKLNFSEWNRPQRETRQAGRDVQRGEMPPWYYVLIHPNANLSPIEKQTLIIGLNATLSQR
jgi:hypothetical protein